MLSKKHLQMVQQLNRQRPIIQITGWQEDCSLASYYRHAQALIFPSLSEGFGIPILEAYFYRIPLLLSNQASLPEVAGDAAIYFDPYNVQDISDSILHFTKQSDHTSLIERQTQRLARYSWKTTSQQLTKLLQSFCKPL